MKVGDRVRIVQEWPPHVLHRDSKFIGMCGVIAEIRSNTAYPYLVRLDNRVSEIFHEVELIEPVTPSEGPVNPLWLVSQLREISEREPYQAITEILNLGNEIQERFGIEHVSEYRYKETS